MKRPSFGAVRIADETMQARAATFANELDPDAEISFRDAQSGSLSVSRVEGKPYQMHRARLARDR